VSIEATGSPAPADPFRDFLGAEVTRNADGTVTATLAVGPEHLNPHGTVHGVVLYAVAGVAIAALANDAVHSGVVSAVHLDYLRPGRPGDVLVAHASVDTRTEREDLLLTRVSRQDGGELLLQASARATRRKRTP
jgi:acyl-CoA thioesterase